MKISCCMSTSFSYLILQVDLFFEDLEATVNPETLERNDGHMYLSQLFLQRICQQLLFLLDLQYKHLFLFLQVGEPLRQLQTQ